MSPIQGNAAGLFCQVFISSVATVLTTVHWSNMQQFPGQHPCLHKRTHKYPGGRGAYLISGTKRGGLIREGGVIERGGLFQITDFR